MHHDDGSPHATTGPSPDAVVDALPGDETPADGEQGTAALGPPDAAAAGAAEGGEIGLRLGGIEATLAELALRLDAENDRAAARERVIDRQHNEIERLRSAERAGTMRPVITDLCRLRNDLLRQAATLSPETTGAQLTVLLESFAASVEEALDRCGVEVLPREIGAPFVPGRQQVAGVVSVLEPERDGTVAEVLQDGYAEIASGRVVSPARITLHRTAAAGSDRNGTKENTNG